MNTRKKGYDGETRAAEYLLNKGYTIISRNYQARGGEIDFIAREPGGELVFVEVKSRYQSRNAEALLFSNITAKKREKLRTLVNIYLLKNFKRECFPPHRIDVVGVVVDPRTKKPLLVEHSKSVV